MPETILGRYLHQQRAAKYRGIEWLFTFDEWFDVWTRSGHWEQRGRGANVYVMSRLGDKGPYASWNVVIQPANKNNSENPQKKSDLPMGVNRSSAGRFMVFRRMKGDGRKSKYLGVFDTIDEAVEVYESGKPRYASAEELARVRRKASMVRWEKQKGLSEETKR